MSTKSRVMVTTRPGPILYLSDARGVYIPRDFATGTRRDCVAGVDDDTWTILESGPDHEWYWEAWHDVMRDAIVTDPDTGTQYHVYQEGDCWLVPVGMEWDERTEFFCWPDDTSEEG